MMTLYILIGSAVAISTLVLLNMWLGGWSPATIGSLEVAIARLRDDHVVFTPGDGILSSDSLSALVASNTGDTIGVVVVRGAGFVTRLVTPGSLKAVDARDDGSLVLTFRGDTIRPVTLLLGSPHEAYAWAERLTGGDQ
tara:strand:- start:1643 stop:2059 length:417 start_codon:yes stop_codon:yes gene_type:complete